MRKHLGFYRKPPVIPEQVKTQGSPGFDTNQNELARPDGLARK
jgi:hypothetical protein